MLVDGYTIEDTDRKHWLDCTFTAVSEVIAIFFVMIGIGRQYEAQKMLETSEILYYNEEIQKYVPKEEASKFTNDSKDKKSTSSYARSVALARSMLQRIGKIGQ